jgi:hypothetical protein
VMDVSSSFCDIVWVHDAVYSSKYPGNLDKLSASVLLRPGRYLISKLKSESSPTHRSPVALSLAVVRI